MSVYCDERDRQTDRQTDRGSGIAKHLVACVYVLVGWVQALQCDIISL